MSVNLLESAQRLVPVACQDLLASIGYRASTRRDGDLSRLLARPQDYAAGIIDFTGTAIAGRIVLLSAFDFFASSHPVSMARPGSLRPQSAADWIRVRDWTMELSNQLLGRVKNQLCTLGVVVEASLPRAVSGHALVVTVRERKGAHHAYAAGGHEVVVWFEASVTGAVVQGPRVDPLGEGVFVQF